LLFVILTLVVASGAPRPADASIEVAARPLWSPMLAWTWAALYVVGSFLVSAALLLAVAALLGQRDRRLALALVIAFFAGNTIELALKHSLLQPSPLPVAGMIHVRLPEDAIRQFIFARLGMLDAGGGDAVNSYLSGHMLRSLLLLASVAAAFPRPAVRVASAVSAIAVALILVAARVHWASDVAGGALLGWALIAAAVSIKLPFPSGEGAGG